MPIHRLFKWMALLPLIALGGCSLFGPSQPITLGSDLASLPVIPDGVVSRAISWENQKGEPGQGGKTLDGRKGSPCIPYLRSGHTATMMDIDGCGVIRHIWFTIPDRDPEALRNIILRMYWDGSETPSVEVPIGDFFGTAHGRAVTLDSSLVTATAGRGFNCYFPMPFETHARVTLENDMANDRIMPLLFYQIDYELRDRLPRNTGRFHASFRRQNPTVMKQDFIVLDGAEGPGLFIGCVIGVRPLRGDWWGEGEMKFYMDGDTTHPTICGTGAEDYFNCAWGMQTYENAHHGCTLFEPAGEFFKFGLASMYRWHVPDPVYFRSDFKAKMQQIGHDGKLFERSDDWCATAFWYQAKPCTRMPTLPNREQRTEGLIPPK